MKKLQILFWSVALVSLYSCTAFNPSVMFRDKGKYNYDQFVKGPDSTYRISPNDILNVRILNNDGEALVNITGGVEGDQKGNSQFGGIPILVEYDGTAKLPQVGRVMLKDMTRRQAEDELEKKYAAFYPFPFVTITISNRHVIVFPGTGNNAKIVDFKRDNMNLLEALAEVGGIAHSGKAKKIKLIRGDLNNPKVYKINLSTLKGMKEADLVLQSGDIIYVEPYVDPGLVFRQDVLPYFTAVTSVASIVGVIIALTK